MKKVFSLLSLILCFCVVSFAQEQNAVSSAVSAAASKIPSSKVKALDGTSFDTQNLSNDGKPIVISFWATWCKPCVKELNAILEHYEEWQKETGVKLVAISIDDPRTVGNVAPFVESMEWPYEVYTDENYYFKNALNVVNVPHTFLVDGKGNIVWTHTSYAPGDENHLYEEIKKLVEKK